MSEPSQHIHTNPESEHGTTASYVVGFILSLAFTLVAYWLVVSHLLSSSLLLQMILGFAFAQMCVQVLFFLHLGRGPKPLYNIIFFMGTIGLILVVVGGSIFIMNNLHYNMTPADVAQRLAQDEAIYQVDGQKTGACRQNRANHRVVISDGIVSPVHTTARLCDTLTFINKDGKTRDIGFGVYPQNTYGGLDELAVRKRQSETLTLDQAGSFRFHDRLDLGVAGDFVVEQ